MSIVHTNGTRSIASPFIVEVIGLAGTGKSTLTRNLCQENQQFTLGRYLDVRSVKQIPYMVRHTLQSLPIILSKPLHGRWFTRREVAKVIYLDGWHRVLRTNDSANGVSIIIDQGPIYDMVTLYSFGPEALRDPRHDWWWWKMFDNWTQTVDMVIWLVAPMEILIERIRSREQWHPVKENSVKETREYLLRYQSGYEYIMSELMTIHDLSVFQLDTGNTDVEDIVSQARNAIISKRSATLAESPPDLPSKTTQFHSSTLAS